MTKATRVWRKISASSFAMSMLLAATGGSVGLYGCVGDGGSSNPMSGPMPGKTPTPFMSPSPAGPEPLGNNIMRITVNGSLCSGTRQYINKPCVSITICSPTTGECQAPIDNILLDTGSVGLRLFGSLVNVPLPNIETAQGDLAECVQFGDGASQWGPIKYADLKLGQKPAVRVPVHIVDSTYAQPPRACTASQSFPDESPQQVGFNGILGLGLHPADCGVSCANNPNNNMYYACDEDSCISTAAPQEQQVYNPVARMNRDNNGVILKLPAVDARGAVSVEGQLIFGIGTQPNNEPGDVKVYYADMFANFTTVFDAYSAEPMVGFIDSGSSVLFFPSPAGNLLPDCGSESGGAIARYRGFYCPAAMTSLTATNHSTSDTTNGPVRFEIGNAASLVESGNWVIPTLANNSGLGFGAVFDWGLPFFFGRDVYVGIEGTVSPLSATGRYWAY